MSKNYVVGFPRIGEKRELKKVLEQYWAKQIDFKEVEYLASQLKKRHWRGKILHSYLKKHLQELDVHLKWQLLIKEQM